MGFKTQPAFVHSGNWDATSDSHPGMKWMHEYTVEFDKGAANMNFDEFATSDFQYNKSTGEAFAPGSASVE